MSSPNPTLNDFVCSIPICQPEADLGSILNIFQQTNCECLAIPREKNTWGIINSQTLLSFLAKSWQQFPVATIAHPKIARPQNTIFPTVRDFKSLIEPAIVYQADTPLKEFLNCLQADFLDDDRQNKYLIVRERQLQGRLDLTRLLKHLAATASQSTPGLNLPSLSSPLLNLINFIDFIELPLKIETSEGRNFYLNRCWQARISSVQDPQQQPLEASVADWWLKKQLETPWQDGSENNDESSYLSEQYRSQDRLNALPKKTNLNPEKLRSGQQQLRTVIEHLAASYPKENSSLDSTDDLALGIHWERGTKWNYLKLPLTLARQQLGENQTAKYWLVLAIESSLASSENAEPTQPKTANTSTTVDRLLGTVSHELKSPLTGIVGLSSLLGAQKLGMLNQKQTRYVQLIHSSGKQLMSIVNDLLELTSLTTGKRKLKPEKIELKHLCARLYQQVLTKLESTKEEKLDPAIATPQLQLDIETGLEVAIANKLCLSSIISHLMLETLEFSDPESILAIKVEIKSLNKAIAITVSNHTTEVSSVPWTTEDLDSLQRGAKLNLVLAKYLAEVLQGGIDSEYWLNSCRFTLKLPLISFQPDFLAAKNDRASESAPARPNRSLTILCLYPEPEAIDATIGSNHGLDFNLKDWAEQDWSDYSFPQSHSRYRIIEAEGLEQAHILARIWQLDVIVLDGYQIADSARYLRSLQKSEYLSALPLITLDTATTEAANQIEGLNVYPCLLPAECRSIQDLMQVIQIATDF
ncbi:MAG: hybrid sensor histidine kinase/response regulator [Pleurocapsa sp. MO_226.B13]|nr:hybrid sensor histidine kinase/response regulator [Pleurocapsa sp. MO_226.B13]